MICRCYLAMALGPRDQQEDCLLAGERVLQRSTFTQTLELEPSNLVLAVCDGMGGHEAGEVASRFVCEGLREHRAGISAREPELLQTLDRIQDDSRLQLPPECGTTVAGMAAEDGQGLFFNLGDSRIYRLDENGIERISHDHSPVQELLDRRLISETEAFRHPHRNLISSGVGPAFSASWIAQAVYVTTHKLSGDLQYLFCSDGVTDLLRDRDLGDILGSDPLTNGPALMETLQYRGLKDNTSYMIAQFVP